MKRNRYLKFKNELKSNYRKEKPNSGNLETVQNLNMHYRLADEGITPAKLGNL